MPVSAQQLNRWAPSSRLKVVTNHQQMISDFRQQPIPRVPEEQIVMKAGVRTTQFLRVQVTVKVRRACIPSHCIGLNPACLLNACCTSIGRNCKLLFLFPLSDEASGCIPYHSYAQLWTRIFMIRKHCSIETHNEYVINCCSVYKILYGTSKCELHCMTYLLAILTLTTTGID